MRRPHPIAVLLSGGGTTLQNLIDVITAGKLDARIVQVVSSRPGVRGTERAEAADIPTCVIERKTFESDDAFSDAVFDACGDAELICMAGWLRKLIVPQAWTGRVMNVHPSLLPAFGGPGMYGHHVHAAVLRRGCKVTGCTVHYVDNELDGGPIVAQRCVPVQKDDTAETLAERVQATERELYPEAIAGHLRKA